MRDVSELRRRDRMLLSKDATIREIHHRVKNNLQTIASLLRLQGRRLASPEAKQALDESVRRIRSIALVHETLAYEAGNTVPFGEIIRPLVRVVEDGLTSPDRHIRFTVEGDPGDLPAEVATPLAVVLTELLQNAVEHGFPDNGSGSIREGAVLVRVARDNDEAIVEVVDNAGVIPRNHRVEAVLDAAVHQGDFAPLEAFLAVLATPYAVAPHQEAYSAPPAPSERVSQTFCGT
jgi:two-component sensor histidine kinase